MVLLQVVSNNFSRNYDITLEQKYSNLYLYSRVSRDSCFVLYLFEIEGRNLSKSFDEMNKGDII